MGHWHVRRGLVPEHLNFEVKEEKDGFFEVEAEKSGHISPQAFSWLIRHFSRVGDCIIDLFSFKAKYLVAAMQCSRNGIYFGNVDDEETVRCSVAAEMRS